MIKIPFQDNEVKTLDEAIELIGLINRFIDYDDRINSIYYNKLVRFADSEAHKMSKI